MRTQFIKAAARIECEPLAIARARLDKRLLGTPFIFGIRRINPQARRIHAVINILCSSWSACRLARRHNAFAKVNPHLGHPDGRERCLRFTGNRREIWTKAQPLLRSPVSKRLFIQHTKNKAGGIRAGLTALAEHSMLAPTAYITYALSREDWKLLRQRRKAVVVPVQEPDAQEIEVWSYPPALFAERDVVDPLSLYLSLRDNQDERIESALEGMMRKLEW